MNNAGYVSSRRNKINGHWATIYRADDAALDAGGERYAVVCEAHSSVVGQSSITKARHFTKYPEHCEECMKDAPDSPDEDGVLDSEFVV